MRKTTLQKTSTEALVAELNSRTNCLVVGNIWSVNFLTEKYNLDDEMAALFIREQQKACLGLASATDDLHEAMTDFVSTYDDCKQHKPQDKVLLVAQYRSNIKYPVIIETSETLKYHKCVLI